MSLIYEMLLKEQPTKKESITDDQDIYKRGNSSDQ